MAPPATTPLGGACRPPTEAPGGACLSNGQGLPQWTPVMPKGLVGLRTCGKDRCAGLARASPWWPPAGGVAGAGLGWPGLY